jgi:hypothetical protein
MYVNAKMIPVETIPGMGTEEDEREMVGGVKSSVIYLIQCKKFYKCHNVPTPRRTIKKKSMISYNG